MPNSQAKCEKSPPKPPEIVYNDPPILRLDLSVNEPHSLSPLSSRSNSQPPSSPLLHPNNDNNSNLLLSPGRCSKPHSHVSSSHSFLSVPEFFFRDSIDTIRKSLDVLPIDTHDTRSPVFKNVDSLSESETPSNLFSSKDLADNHSSLHLGLEDALGKDSNWLIPKFDAPKTPEITVEDFANHHIHSISPSGIPSLDPTRDLEEGFHSPASHPSPHRSPVQNISLAVQNISTRIMGQKSDDEKSPVSTPAAVTRSDPMLRPSLLLNIPNAGVDKYKTPLSSPRDVASPGILHESPYNKNQFHVSSTLSSPSNSCFTEKNIDCWKKELPVDDLSTPNLCTKTDSVSSNLPLKLVGRSLMTFGPTNRFRIFLYHQLHKVWVQPVSFFLIIFHTVILTVANIPNIFAKFNSSDQDNYMLAIQHWNFDWLNWSLLAIFICYTTICIANIIAYGLWDDRQLKKNIKSDSRCNNQETSFPSPPVSPILKGLRKWHVKHTPLVPTFTNLMPKNRKDTLALQKAHTIHVTSSFRYASERAYLRSSWNRIQFIAIVSYWVSLLFAINQFDFKNELFVFRMLSTLPILHLLNLTSGTSSVLRSLKAASTLLSNVGIFVGFFWILFAIIGVQSFNNSLRRNCMWINPLNSSDTYLMTNQYCGSFMLDGERVPFLDIDNAFSTVAKGYTCPTNSKCLTVDNPNSGTISFDNILQSLELVFVIMSVNTFSDIMYNIVDAEYLIASLFFIIGTLALGLWLTNLFIAVIVSSFARTRESMGININNGDAAAKAAALFSGTNIHIQHICRNTVGRIYHYCRDIPLIVIFVGLIAQCTISTNTSQSEILVVQRIEMVVTGILFLEILLRFAIYLPRIKLFFASVMNCIDITLAVATIIILIPPIRHNSVLYGWLSVFQIARFYRLVIAVGFVRDLWARVLSNFRPILNITLFYYLLTFLAAIFACVLLRGVIPIESNGETNFVAFQHLANSFLGMYIVSSTENWTSILYLAVESTHSKFSRICVAAFFISWFVLSSFVVLNMFIAVITENLEISPENKRKEQIKAFFIDMINEQQNKNYLKEIKDIILSKFKEKKRKTDFYNGNRILQFLQREKMDTFLVSEEDDDISYEKKVEEKNSRSLLKSIIAIPPKVINRYLKTRFTLNIDNPFHDPSDIKNYKNNHDRNPEEMVGELIRVKTKLEKQQREYLDKNPNYNRSLNLFRPDHPLRVLCQSIVAPSHGIRLEGTNPRPMVWYLFSIAMLLSTVGLVTIAVIVTPIYYKSLIETQPRVNWVILTDAMFVGIFTLESIIKIIADGFYFTPNAYLRSVWGIIDFTVLITLWVNLIQQVTNQSKASRLIRAFKALRALRLLSFSRKAQELFHNVIIVGIWKLFTAAIVAFGLLFPFSVWGLNIFRGRLFFCNDGNYSGDLSNCVGEYLNTPFNWPILSPKGVFTSYFDFDNFGHSLLILFEIISLEGWTDVLSSVINISGPFNQPEYYGNAFNGVFVMFYNLIGTIFIITLFVSVIIQNYAVKRGSAYMTEEQKNWYEIEKTLKIVQPSLRPPVVLGSFRHKLLLLVAEPSSWFTKVATGNLIVLAIILIVEYHPQSEAVALSRKIVLIFFTSTYWIIMLLRFYALGARKFFRRRWDIYALVVTTISLVLLLIAIKRNRSNVFYSFQKLCLASMLILLVRRSKRLDQLLKTCAASVSDIGNLLVVWAILFLAYGIAFNQVFGLTRLGPEGGNSMNFRTVPQALVLLYKMSMGEGWNQVLNDYLVVYPYCYVSPDGFSDCGSPGYAYALFISWNIISMYTFANMFVSLIYENFSYVSRKPDSNINRDEIRRFKNVWYKFDPNSTGYIPRSELYNLLSELDGYFSIKVHDEPWTVKTILENSKAKTNDKYCVDIQALNKELRTYPTQWFAEKRERYEKFCQHAFLLADPDRGINFHSLLLQFPFYKDMDYSKCLKLHDYIRYRDIERRITSRIKQERTTSAVLLVQNVIRRHVRICERKKTQVKNDAVAHGSGTVVGNSHNGNSGNSDNDDAKRTIPILSFSDSSDITGQQH